MTPRYVVLAGTDTEVGKTFVGCALGRALAASGARVLAVKPVESGCDELAAAERDGQLLARATGQVRPQEALESFGLPLAPPMAARAEGVTLSLDGWLRTIRRYSRGFEWVLVEGAGGLRSPLTDEHDTRDLAQALGASTLLVAADRLGTLNHALLSLESLAARKLPLLAVVLSAPARPDASTGRNAGALRVRCDVPVLELPRLGEEAAARALAPLVPLVLAAP